MSGNIDDNTSRALSQLIGGMSDVASTMIGGRFQEILTSPEFISTIKDAFVTTLNLNDVRINISQILSGSMENLIKNPDFIEALSSLFKNIFLSLMKSEDGQEVISSIMSTFLTGVKEAISEQVTDAKDSLLGEPVKETVKTIIEENSVLIQESIMTAVQGAFVSMRPKVKASIDFSEEGTE